MSAPRTGRFHMATGTCLCGNDPVPPRRSVPDDDALPLLALPQASRQRVRYVRRRAGERLRMAPRQGQYRDVDQNAPDSDFPATSARPAVPSRRRLTTPVSCGSCRPATWSRIAARNPKCTFRGVESAVVRDHRRVSPQFAGPPGRFPDANMPNRGAPPTQPTRSAAVACAMPSVSRSTATRC